MEGARPPLQGVLEKKGLGWFYRPWATREFSFDEHSRILTYRKPSDCHNGEVRGKVKIDDSKPIIEISAVEADGKVNAFEVPVFVVDNGVAESSGKK
jgi:hypothetical protein